jgi:hypothetical protein
VRRRRRGWLAHHCLSASVIARSWQTVPLIARLSEAAAPWDEARQRALDAASDRLDYEGVFCRTAPTTVDGLRAVVQYALTDESCFLKDAAEERLDEFLDNILKCLDRSGPCGRCPPARRWHQLVVGGSDVNVDDPSEAIAHLKELGRRKWPTASEAQQFERALTAPENHALARRAVPIPKPTTQYPFPR